MGEGFERISLKGFQRLVQISSKSVKPPNWIICTQHPIAEFLAQEFGRYREVRSVKIQGIHPRTSLLQLMELILGARLHPSPQLKISQIENLSRIHLFFQDLGSQLIQRGYQLLILDQIQNLELLEPELRILSKLMMCELSKLIPTILICSWRFDLGFHSRFRKFQVI